MSNIPASFSTRSLHNLFSDYGVCDVELGDNSQSSKYQSHHYYAYVNFYSLAEAKIAVSGLNGYSIGTTKLSVKMQGSLSNPSANPSAAMAPNSGVQVYTVKVNNISKMVTESELSDIFTFSGMVALTSMKLNQTPGPFNFAYVNYHMYADADRAVNELNGCSIKHGSKIQVKHCGQPPLQTPALPQPFAPSDTTISAPSSASCTVKALIVQGSTTSSELQSYFSRFGELRDEPKIRIGNPDFAYINFKSEFSARNVTHYSNLELESGVKLKIKTSNTSSGQAVANTSPVHSKPSVSLCEAKHIPCTPLISSILTSSDSKYTQYRSSIAPVSLTCDKSGNGVVLFGERVKLLSAESLIMAVIKDLESKHDVQVVELHPMYIPAFSNQMALRNLLEIEKKLKVQYHVIYASACTQDLQAFSKLVISKLSSQVATDMSSFSVALHQKSPSLAINKSDLPTTYSWSWRDDNHTYCQYDSDSSAKLNEHFNCSPRRTLQLSIPTKTGSATYHIDFVTMKQTNLETGHSRRIKKSISLVSSNSLTWFYEDDSKKMVPYTVSNCLEIENMYQSKKPCDLIINSKTYMFNFDRMVQINKHTLYERAIERKAPILKSSMNEMFLKIQIEGLKENMAEAEIALKQELDEAVVKQTILLPSNGDKATFQTEIMDILQKYFVLTSIHGDNIQVCGVQGYVEQVMLIAREKKLEFEKKWLAQAPLASHSLPTPSNWEPQSDKFALKEVARSSEEWKNVEQQFHKTLPGTRIVTIKRIQNKWLWDRYSFAKQRMSERNAGRVNEQMLFHGTRGTAPEKIYKSEQGFDFRFSSNGMWGTGTYFAVNASYSYNYSYSAGQYKEMLLASVLTGDTHRCPPDGTLKKPPIKPRKADSFEDELYDSVSGHTRGSDVFIIYDHEKAYPCYVISY